MTQNIVVSTDDKIHGKIHFCHITAVSKPREGNAVIDFFGTSVELVKEKIKMLVLD